MRKRKLSQRTAKRKYFLLVADKLVVTKNKKEKSREKFEYKYDDYLIALGEAIIQLRRDANLTQGELAERLEKGQPSVAKLENGPTPNVALRNLYELAEALPVPLSRIFQIAEANLSKETENSSATSWQKTIEEMKKLTPQKQAWLGDIFLTVLKGLTH